MRLTILFGLGIICLAMTNHTELPESEKDIWVNSRLESMSIGQKFHQSFNVLIDLNWKSEKVEESVQYALQNGVGGIVLKGGTKSHFTVMGEITTVIQSSLVMDIDKNVFISVTAVS